MYVPFYEVQALILNREKHLMLRQKVMEKMMKHPEENRQVTMTKEKFYDTFENWLDVTRQLMDDPSLDKSETDYNQVRITQKRVFSGFAVYIKCDYANM